MPTSLPATATKPLLSRLAETNSAYGRVYPGEPIDRQAVHTVYGGAQIFRRDSARRLGDVALASLQEYAPDAGTFARVVGLSEASAHLPGGLRSPVTPALAERLYARVVEKLRREPVEDFRIDFEDGYGTRPDAEEDAHAEQAAAEVAAGMADRTLPPFIGIRIKNFGEGTVERGVRTLDLFLTTLSKQTGG